jgi:hypothetical protein
MNNGAITPTQKTVFLPHCNLRWFGYENACGVVSDIMTYKMTYYTDGIYSGSNGTLPNTRFRIWKLIMATNLCSEHKHVFRYQLESYESSLAPTVLGREKNSNCWTVYMTAAFILNTDDGMEGQNTCTTE